MRVSRLLAVLSAITASFIGATLSVAGEKSYFYDELNRLVRVEDSRGVVIEYTYDAVGNRLTRSVTVDLDHDGRRASLDCDDSSEMVWAVPGEATDLVFLDKLTMNWWPPAVLGTFPGFERYDTVRSTRPDDFVSAGFCLDSDSYDTYSSDYEDPPAGQAFYYLVAAENDCPSGRGPFGHRSDGSRREALSCP